MRTSKRLSVFFPGGGPPPPGGPPQHGVAAASMLAGLLGPPHGGLGGGGGGIPLPEIILRGPHSGAQGRSGAVAGHGPRRLVRKWL